MFLMDSIQKAIAAAGGLGESGNMSVNPIGRPARVTTDLVTDPTGKEIDNSF